MSWLDGIFLGILQGLTEFLPISSSGHLILAEKILALPQNLFFNVMLHLGTLFAVLTVLRKPIFKILRHPFKDCRFMLIVLASLPTFIIALIIKVFLPEKIYYAALPFGFLVTAALLVFTTKNKNNRSLYYKPHLPVLLTGIVQGIAVLPGLSRSGSTIATMSAFNIKREQSAEFSFLLSIPVIIGGAVVEIYEAVKIGAQIEWLPVVLGMIAAYVSGVAALRFLLCILKKTDLRWFALYMLIPFLLSILTA